MLCHKCSVSLPLLIYMYLTVTLLVPTVCPKGCLFPEKPTDLCTKKEVKFSAAIFFFHTVMPWPNYNMKLGLFFNILGEGIASELPTSYPHLTYLLCALLCVRPPLPPPIPFTFCCHPFLSGSQLVVVYLLQNIPLLSHLL